MKPSAPAQPHAGSTGALRADARRNRARILAAREVFAEQGASASTAEVARRALQGGWDDDLQHRALAIIFNGLRPATAVR